MSGAPDETPISGAPGDAPEGRTPGAEDETPPPPSFAAPSWMPPGTLTRESRALELFAIIALCAVIWVTLPVAAGILFGALMAFTLQPLFLWLEQRWARPLLASAATVTLAALCILGTVTGFGSWFAARGVALTRVLLVDLGPDGALHDRVETLLGHLSQLGLSADQLTEKLRDAAAEIATSSAQFAEAAAAATASGLLGLFFALMTLHMILLNWGTITDRLEIVSPLRPQYTRALLEEFQRVGRATLLGTVVTGVAQGLFAAIGFFLTSAPEPIFFGMATAVASLVPGVGTLLVWVPIAIFQMATGHPGQGIAGLIWGSATIVGVSDYVIRPKIVADEAVPALVTFVALFGGVEVFGLKGLVVGPVVMSLAVATLRIYAREAASRRAMP